MTREIHERFEIGPGYELDARIVSGRIRLETWDQAAVEIQGTLDEGVELDVGAQGKRVWARVRHTDLRSWLRLGPPFGAVGDALLTIRAPRQGRASLRSVSGDLEVEGLEGDLDLNTVSGDVELARLRGGLRARSVSGDLNCRDSSGSLFFGTVSGDGRLQACAWGSLEAKTVSGGIELEGPLAPQGRYLLNTVSGDFTLAVPEGSGFLGTLRSFGGQLRSSLPGTTGGAAGSGTRELRVGDASARIEMKSMSGDLEIRSWQGSAPEFRPAPPPEPPPTKDEGPELEILSALERGEIDVEEALRRLEEQGS